VNASAQFYTSARSPIWHNIRLTQHTRHQQLNAAQTWCATCTTTFIVDYFGNNTSGATTA
jgi:hypothetical protein